MNLAGRGCELSWVEFLTMETEECGREKLEGR